MEQDTNLLLERIQKLEYENTILKQQKIEVTEAKELYLKIFEEFPALIWRSGLDKLCNYFNKTWLEFTGRTMEQEYGHGWAEGVHANDFDRCLRTYVEAFDKHEAFLMEYRMKNKFDEYRWIRDFGRPFFDLDNSFLGYIGSCYDITEIKDNELRLLELNATKDKFFSIIAHDLKSPFNSIIGFNELMLEQIKEKEYNNLEEVATLVLNSSYKAMQLLTNLMTWAQTQSGRIPFAPGFFDMKQMLESVLNLLTNIAEQKSISIQESVEENCLVFADQEMINTVLRNLISNAIKFTKAGGRILIASTRKDDEITLSVSDNGIGIAEENLKKLFGVTGNYSTLGTNNESGTGLGLIICKEFVEKNKGKVWVESHVKEGSTFYFSLPTKE